MDTATDKTPLKEHIDAYQKHVEEFKEQMEECFPGCLETGTEVGIKTRQFLRRNLMYREMSGQLEGLKMGLRWLYALDRDIAQAEEQKP